ncbi:MAG: alpha/beta hydrolase [Candidatus Falkowbacteria bacterium]
MTRTNFIKITLLFAVGVFISGCGIPELPLDNKIVKIREQDYVLNYPQKIPAGELDLIFLITPGGSENEANGMIELWRPYLIKNSLAAASVIDWQQDKLKKVLTDLQQKYKFRKIFVTGFSNGGYNSCYFASLNPDLTDGIIPMGAYCSHSDTLTLPKVPILAVNGEKDTWARGDDLKSVTKASRDLKAHGINQEEMLIPGLGHEYPVSALPRVIEWIKSH